VQHGAELFEEGDYAGARDAFSDAYEIHPAPELLFNIASTYRRERDYTLALDYYRMFIASGSDDENLVQLANETIVQIADLLEERERSEREERKRQRTRAVERSQVVVATQPPPAPRAIERVDPEDRSASAGASWRRIGRITLLAGGLLAAGGGVDLYRARSASQELDALPPGTPWGPSEQQLFEQGEQRDRRGKLLLITGGALAVTGAVLYYIGSTRNDEARQLAVVPTDGGAALVFGGGF
jgi:hypothetical protein